MDNESGFPPALIAALRRVLNPVARLMLARGLTLPMAVELLKRVFVEVADRDFRLEGKPATDSRISLLTGVHRKDVRRLRQLPHVEAALPPKVSLGAQLVGAWLANPRFRDAGGRIKPLARTAKAGGEDSFEALVAAVSKDIRARPVLDEWLRLGVASLNAEDEVVLNTAAFVPQEGFDEKLAYLGMNLGDHAAAATDNVLGRADPWFERSVHYRSLSAERVAQLRGRLDQEGMRLLTGLNAEARLPDGAGSPECVRFTAGVYFYSERMPPSAGEGDPT
ncbi:MAG: hypothetical protein JNK22_03795 [Rhodocyclaceae bacterium]|nr:hypothetical protein [Rhodocyclaceae bacterium]